MDRLFVFNQAVRGKQGGVAANRGINDPVPGGQGGARRSPLKSVSTHGIGLGGYRVLSRIVLSSVDPSYRERSVPDCLGYKPVGLIG